MKNFIVTRRKALGLTGAGLLAATGARPLWAAQTLAANEPDTVIYNAKIYTVEPAMSRAEAFAVKGGRFVAVGSNESVRALIGKGTKVVDGQQMTVVPG